MVEIRASFAHGRLVCAPSLVIDVASLAPFAAFLQRVRICHRAIHQAPLAVGLAVLQQIGIGLFLWAVQAGRVGLAAVSVGATGWPQPILSHLFRVPVFLSDDATTVHAVLLVEFGVDEVEDLVAVVDHEKQLGVHALLHGRNELPRLDELPDRRLALESLGDVYLHRGGDLLDLFQPVLIDLRLDL